MAKSDDKWLALVPDQPAAEAARYALRVRAAGVFQRLPLAADSPDDPEHVHQLRVATRRTGAVLRLFAGCFPGKKLDRAARRIRDLRRAAGSARDWDVLLLATAGDETLPAEARFYLLGHAAAGRADAQGELRSAAVKGPKAQAAVDELADAARQPKSDPGQTAADLGRAELTALFDDFAAGVAAGPTEPDQLHQLRIAGKRLRYGIEVFAGCFPPALRQHVYPAVADLQEVLGAANDAHVAVARLAAVRAGLRFLPAADALDSALAEAVRRREAEVAGGPDRFREWADRWRLLLADHPPGTLFATETAAPGDPADGR